jgi:hypothetical protein
LSSHSAARSAALTAVLALLVAGCAEAPDLSPATTSTTATRTPGTNPVSDTQVAQLDTQLVAASKAPAYSATMSARTLLDNRAAAVTTGKVNLNAEITGHFTVRTTAFGDSPAITLESVLTAEGGYAREVGTGAQKGEWQEVPPSETSTIADFAAYARLLLKQGPTAVKGEEVTDGTSATRLSGSITVEDVQDIEPNLYNRLRSGGVKSFDCDIWVDNSGRVVRLEQWIRLGDSTGHNILLMSDFGRPFTQKAPKS